LAPAIGFSHATICDGVVWVGGQIGSDPSGKILAPDDITAQFGLALENLRAVLSAAGCSSEGILKLTYYVTDVAAYRSNLKPIGEAYRRILGAHYPASSLFEVKGLFDPEALIEIECVAVQGKVELDSGTEL
jgi:enamine deaminase RidA (YjgF/YER057c/UK114 family)